MPVPPLSIFAWLTLMGTETSCRRSIPPHSTLCPFTGRGLSAEQFGLTQAANQSTGSIQIQTKGQGGFNALALLLNGGLLSTTAVVQGVSGMIDVYQFQGSYTGSFHNATTSTDSPATAQMATVRPTSGVIFFLTTDLAAFHQTGSAFFGFIGTYSTNAFSAVATSGGGQDTMTLTANPDGTMSMIGTFTKAGSILTSLNCTGLAHPEQITANCVAGFNNGASNNLTMTLNHTDQ